MALEHERPDAPDASGRSSSNSVSGTVHGPVAQIGVVHGDVNLVTGAPVRTRYREQVRRIAPPELIGREAELADLSSFCTSPSTAGGYRWWRAPAWSGKSALMSTFVLNPPQGVRVVSFFITARLAAQNDRTAFIENVLEQLVTILGQDLPPMVTEATREGHLLGLLAEAAGACRDRGEHFVLLVDGLDEDRGVTTGLDAHSIAALLPLDPPAGLRVIVAGRPDPPIPADVPDHHPLRDPAIARPLTTSPAAQAERADMERELKRLLHGSSTEQDLLGLLTAAGGGLTAADLAELTGLSVWDVDDHLRTVTGRSFRRRNAHYEPGRSPDVYLLGHEELHHTATAMLGPRLAEYRDRLHRWADRHRARGWPAASPEYLLRGYYSMLTATGDLPRMVVCATDAARHDLLLDVSGGDAAAMAEITATQEAVLAAAEPDLVPMSRLAVHHDRLTSRNDALPLHLPALTARIGLVDRAEALANSIPGIHQRDHALLGVVQSVIGGGDLDRAIELTSTIRDAWHYGRALEAVVAALVDRGDLDAARELCGRAETSFRSVRDPWQRDQVMASLVRCAVRTGEADRAEALVEAIESVPVRDQVWPAVVACLADRDLDRAVAVARSIGDVGRRGDALRIAVEAAAASGDLDRAAGLAVPIADPTAQGRALNDVVWAVLRRDDFDRAEALSRLITDGAVRGEMLVRIARALVRTDPGRALALLGDAVDAAATTTPKPEALGSGPWVAVLDRDRVLAAVVDTAIAAGGLDLAGAVVDRMVDVRHLSRALGAVVGALVAAGDVAQARRVLDRVEVVLDFSGPYPVREGQALVHAVRAAVVAGDHARADRMFSRARETARAVPDGYHEGVALRAMTDAAIALGDLERARAVTGSITDPVLRGQAVARVVRALVAAGDLDPALSLARSIRHPGLRSIALGDIAVRAATAGDLPRAKAAVREAVTFARAEGSRLREVHGLVIESIALDGDLDRAEAMAGAITQPAALSEALTSVAMAAWRHGDHERARGLVLRAGFTLDPADPIEELMATLWSDNVVWRRSSLRRHVEAAGDATGNRPSSPAAPLTTPKRVRDRVVASIRTAVAEGDLDRAELIALSPPEGTEPDELLTWLLDELVTRKSFDQAIPLGSRITHPLWRQHAITQLVTAMRVTGEVAHAGEVIAAELERHDERWVRALVVDLALAEGDLDRAEALAVDLGKSALSKVVRALAAAGHLDRVDRLALAPLTEGRIVLDAVRALIIAGETERARRLTTRAEAAALAMHPNTRRDLALSGLVDVALIARQFDRATTLVRSIRSTPLRASAVVRIVSDLLGHGEREHAGRMVDLIPVDGLTTEIAHVAVDLPDGPRQRLIARMLAAKAWPIAIDTLRRTTPEGLDAITDELASIARVEARFSGGRGERTPD
ncbi:hypothetical protein AB0H12_08520 [Actinosynnema sp. NPDC023794]